MDLINTTKQLREAVSRLSQSPFVTVDTEFIRETTFWPELCLIQMADRDAGFLVDPLAPGMSLDPFFELMGNDAIVKVFHAARQDIEIVYKMGGLIPAPLFDTQVAAMVCGFGDSISYDQLVGKITGERLDKTSRFTDWRRRPLSDQQLTYALGDVTHLVPVYEHLNAKLIADGRTDWVAEEMALLSSPETYDIHPDDAWKRLKLRVRKPIELAVLQKVAAWREREARDRNVPRSRILKDDSIYEIAQQHPKDTKALGRLRTIARGWEQSTSAGGLLEAINEALAMPREALPKVPRPRNAPEGSSAAAELLRVLLRMVSEEHGVAPKVLAAGEDLDRIASDGATADVPAMHGWRREVFGDPALRLISGETALRFDNRKVTLVELDSLIPRRAVRA